MRLDISIIIPFFNEAENIPRLINELNQFIRLHSSISFEVVFVDDGSSDNSTQIIRETSPVQFETTVVQLSKNFGSHAALRAGIKECKGKFVTFVYADLQDPLNLVLQMFEVALKSNDIVWSCRTNANGSFMSKITSKGYATLMRKYVSAEYPEYGFDVVMFSSRVAECLNKNVEANSSIFLQILNLGFSQSKIYYFKENRIVGKSKWTVRKKIKLFIDSFVAFSYAPIRLVTVVGVVLFLLGLIFSGYLGIRQLIYSDLKVGWPLGISIISMGFGLTNISLGVIAEYHWRTLDAVRKRPVFVVKEVLKISP